MESRRYRPKLLRGGKEYTIEYGACILGGEQPRFRQFVTRTPQPTLGDAFFLPAILAVVMARTVELDDELVERLEGHLEEDETIEELIEELVNIYEQEGRFTDQGL